METSWGSEGDKVDARLSGVSALLADQGAATVISGVLARSITEAHAVNPASWSLTSIDGGRGIRLNVGRVFALTVRKDGVSLLLETGQVKLEDSRFAAWEYSCQVRQSRHCRRRGFPGVVCRAVTSRSEVWEHCREYLTWHGCDLRVASLAR